MIPKQRPVAINQLRLFNRRPSRQLFLVPGLALFLLACLSGAMMLLQAQHVEGAGNLAERQKGQAGIEYYLLDDSVQGIEPQASVTYPYADLDPYWTWHSEVITEALGRVFPSSFVLDRSGRPHVAFQLDASDSGSQILYTHWTGSEWESSLVDTNAAGGSVALDSAGNPHIAFFDLVGKDLKYASWTGYGWSIQTVDSRGWVGTSAQLLLDRFDRPHIAYEETREGWSTILKYASWDGASWAIDEVDSPGEYTYDLSFALDDAGNAHMSYPFNTVAGTPGWRNLRYAYWSGTDWITQTVDTLLNVKSSALVLDTSAYPHICYFGYSSSVADADPRLKYAEVTGNGWETDTLYMAWDLYGYGEGCSYALGSDGTSFVSYAATMPGSIQSQGKLARKVAGTWYAQAISATNRIVLDENQNVHLVYSKENWDAYPAIISTLSYLVGVPPTIDITSTANVTQANVTQVVTYTYVVRNDLVTTLENLLLIDKFGVVALDKDRLQTKETATGRRTYTVLEDDLPGPLVNVITATASPSMGPLLTTTASLAVPLLMDPGISVSLAANTSNVRVGETVTYTYGITNTGDVTLHSVVAQDDLLGIVFLNRDSLAPGEAATGMHVRLAAEGDLPGPITNTVIVSALPPAGAPLTAVTTYSCMVYRDGLYLPALFKVPTP